MGAESAGMREKLLEGLGLIASTVQSQTHNILRSISATENSTYLPNIISQVILTISKGYLDSGVELDAKAIGMATLY